MQGLRAAVMAAACCRLSRRAMYRLTVAASGPPPAAGGGGRTLCTDEAASRPPAFTDPEVQRILAAITRAEVERVFRPVPQELKEPRYKLLTDEQLAEARERAVEAARQRLRMPPVLEARAPVPEPLLAEEPLLAGADTASYVFTDISYGLPHRERFIVVREPSGRLRKAAWAERDRMIQVYFPREGRSVIPPPLFQDRQLASAFGRDQHEHVLDRAQAQFEPDSSDYIRVHRLAYEDLDRRGRYQLLRSTRHFGGMAWHLTRSRRGGMEGLLLDMIQRGLLEDAADLLRLHALLHPDSPSALEARDRGAQGTELIRVYMRTEARAAGVIELALQAFEEACGRAASSSS